MEDELKDRKALEKKYPGNSYNKVESKVRAPVVQGRSIKKKKTIGERFATTVYSQESKNIIDYVLYDVLIPATKATIMEMINSALDIKFYGTDNRRDRRDRSRSTGYVSYSSYSSSPKERKPERREVLSRHPQKFEDVVMDSRSDAQIVLDSMAELVDAYGVCTVAEYYDFAGVNSEWTDHKYGWDNLSTAVVRKIREGYIIDLPRAEALD